MCATNPRAVFCGFLLAPALFASSAFACIWDSKTLSDEKRKDPTLAQAILSPEIPKEDLNALKARIDKLQSSPKKDDPAWWNDLAGAYLRLSQPEEAVKTLEPLTNTFPGDYGLHANLGTAYHLLGRFGDAEREIARDLEINPEAHFGFGEIPLGPVAIFDPG